MASELLIDSPEHSTSNRPAFLDTGIRLLGRKILGRKCRKPDIDLGDGKTLFIPEMPHNATDKQILWSNHKDHTNWVQVLRYGPDCRYLQSEWWEDYDVYMLFPEWAHGLYGLGDGYYILDETLLDDDVETLYNGMSGNPEKQMQTIVAAVVWLQERPK